MWASAKHVDLISLAEALPPVTVKRLQYISDIGLGEIEACQHATRYKVLAYRRILSRK